MKSISIAIALGQGKDLDLAHAIQQIGLGHILAISGLHVTAMLAIGLIVYKLYEHSLAVRIAVIASATIYVTIATISEIISSLTYGINNSFIMSLSAITIIIVAIKKTREIGVILKFIYTITLLYAYITPLSAYLFVYFSPYSIISNLLVLPLLPIALIAGLIAAIVGAWFAHPIDLLLAAIISAIDAVPYRSIEIDINFTVLLIYYFVITTITYYTSIRYQVIFSFSLILLIIIIMPILVMTTKDIRIPAYNRALFGEYRVLNGLDTRQMIIGKNRTHDRQIKDRYNNRMIKIKNAQIDHIVPLSLAWRRGLHARSRKELNIFYNFRSNLIITHKKTNRKKGSKGILQWLPKNNKCPYIRRYIKVLKYYRLKIKEKEKVMFRECKSKQ